MNVKELKEIIKDLDDNVEVLVGDSPRSSAKVSYHCIGFTDENRIGVFNEEEEKAFCVDEDDWEEFEERKQECTIPAIELVAYA